MEEKAGNNLLMQDVMYITEYFKVLWQHARYIEYGIGTSTTYFKVCIMTACTSIHIHLQPCFLLLYINPGTWIHPHHPYENGVSHSRGAYQVFRILDIFRLHFFFYCSNSHLSSFIVHLYPQRLSRPPAEPEKQSWRMRPHYHSYCTLLYLPALSTQGSGLLRSK